MIFVLRRLSNGEHAPDANNHTPGLFRKRCPFGIEKTQRFFGTQCPVKGVQEGELVVAVLRPRRGESKVRFAFGIPADLQSFGKSLLTLCTLDLFAQHPAEGRAGCRVRWLDIACWRKVAVGIRAGPGIGMLLSADKFERCHERGSLVETRRSVLFWQTIQPFSGILCFDLVTLAFADSWQNQATRVFPRVCTDRPCPTAVMPRNSDSDVMSGQQTRALGELCHLSSFYCLHFPSPLVWEGGPPRTISTLPLNEVQLP